MKNADFLGNGWKFPISVEEGKLVTSEGEDSIKDSIMIILGTAKGERVMRPDFGCGIDELVFAPLNTSTSTLIDFHVREALLIWEPRIDVLNVIVSTEKKESGILYINIDYIVKASNTKRNLVYPFYLERGGT
jgi:hypothetical protein